MRAPRSVPRIALMLGLHKSDSGGRCVIRMCALPLTVGLTGAARAPPGPAAGAPTPLLLPSSSSLAVSFATMRAWTSPRASRMSCGVGEGREVKENKQGLCVRVMVASEDTRCDVWMVVPSKGVERTVLDSLENTLK